MNSKNKPNITGTHIAYYHLCHRKLWLFAHGLQMEHQSDLVAEGNLVQEFTYQNRLTKWEEVAIEGIKVDYYDPKLRIVREIKKSKKQEKAHIAQVKYYLLVLRRNGIAAEYALLEYPKLRDRKQVNLPVEEEAQIYDWEKKCRDLIAQVICPALEYKAICKQCAYFNFCFS